MKPVVEGCPYPVFLEPGHGAKRVKLRVGNHGRGDSEITELTLTQARLLAYSILREVEEKQLEVDRLSEEASLSTE